MDSKDVKVSETVEKTLSVSELEKELTIKETIKSQVENALQQIMGQIVCLKALIKKAKGEKEPENKEGVKK